VNRGAFRAQNLRTRNSLLILLAFAALALGAATYLALRPPPLLMDALSLRSDYRRSAHHDLRWLIGSLPSLLHVYAFSLLTVPLLQRQMERAVVVAASFWVVVNVLFEVGQAASLKSFWAEFALDGGAGLLVGYFLFGTFDWNDVGFHCSVASWHI
jgi:hypothetical protein